MEVDMNAENERAPLFPSRPSLGRNVLWIASVALIYFVAARLSLLLEFEPEGIAAIWPPEGVFLSAILLTRRALRFYLVGTLCIADLTAELLSGTPFFVSAIYALTLTGDAVLSSWLLLRFVGGQITFTKVREVFGFLTLAVILSNGLLSLVAAAASDLLPGTSSFWNSWKWWAASDGIGNLLATPFILGWASWARSRSGTWNPKRAMEGAALFLPLALLNFVAFSYLSKSALFSLLLPYLTFPFLLWAALRFGVRGVTSAMVILAAIAVSFAAAGPIFGFPFYGSPLNAVIGVQLYLAILAVPSLFLVAAVTERKKIEEALRASEERFKVIAMNTPDHILVQDADLRYVWVVNPQLGLTKGDMIGKTDFDFLGAEDAEKLTKIKREVLASGQPVHVELPICLNDNVEYFDGSYVPKHGPDGKLDGLIGYFRNVTERKHAEEALRSLNERLELQVAQRTEDLRHTVGRLQQLTLEISQAEDRERRRIADLLHDDVQQTLAAARFHLNLLSSEARSPEESQEIIEQVKQMLKEAIEKSRSLSHELSPVLYQVDLIEILNWLARHMQRRHGLVVHVEACGPVDSSSEPLKAFLYRVAQELLFNVVKHAEVREARIRVRRLGRCICLSVVDRGRGFDSQRVEEAAGFGLRTIRERVQLLGGQMKIKSTRGVGSRVLIAVPDEGSSQVAAPTESRDGWVQVEKR
jgi:PAS domain S-box-containing protein